jgi:hypothetical protein
LRLYWNRVDRKISDERDRGGTGTISAMKQKELPGELRHKTGGRRAATASRGA